MTNIPRHIKERLPETMVSLARPDRVLICSDGCEVHHNNKIYVFYIAGPVEGELLWDTESDDWRNYPND